MIDDDSTHAYKLPHACLRAASRMCMAFDGPSFGGGSLFLSLSLSLGVWRCAARPAGSQGRAARAPRGLNTIITVIIEYTSHVLDSLVRAGSLVKESTLVLLGHSVTRPYSYQAIVLLGQGEQCEAYYAPTRT